MNDCNVGRANIGADAGADGGVGCLVCDGDCRQYSSMAQVLTSNRDKWMNCHYPFQAQFDCISILIRFFLLFFNYSLIFTFEKSIFVRVIFNLENTVLLRNSSVSSKANQKLSAKNWSSVKSIWGESLKIDCIRIDNLSNKHILYKNYPKIIIR